MKKQLDEVKVQAIEQGEEVENQAQFIGDCKDRLTD